MRYISTIERMGIEQGYKEGYQQGYLEGYLEGKQEARQEIISKMLQKGFSEEMILEITGLQKHEISFLTG